MGLVARGARGDGDLRESVRDRTLSALRHRIITLELPPGTALSENDLSAELGVSRTPVRESLILLREEGLVQVFPQIGSFVSRVDPERVGQAQFVREAIECSSLGGVPVPLDLEPTADLRGNLDAQREAERAADVDRFFALDEEFHRTLLGIGGHGDAWSVVTSTKAHLDRARRLSLVDARPMDSLITQHTAVVDALVRGQVAVAVTALRTHLRTVFDDVEIIRAAHPHLFGSNGDARPVRRSVTTLT